MHYIYLLLYHLDVYGQDVLDTRKEKDDDLWVRCLDGGIGVVYGDDPGLYLGDVPDRSFNGDFVGNCA